MPYDSLVLNACVKQLKPEITGARINKIHQPDDHTVILRYHSAAGRGKLLISAHPDNGRLHKTEAVKDNPEKAPLFAMVLRKWLEGARITEISALPDERVAQIVFEAKNDLGDSVVLRLIAEIMGKHSNIILVDENGIILDGIRRYGSHLSRYREVLPGRPYVAPPPMHKLPLAPENEDVLAGALYECADISLKKALPRILKGISPILAENIPLLAGLRPDTMVDSLGSYEINKLYRQLKLLSDGLAAPDPVLLRSREGYADYYLFPLPSWEGKELKHCGGMNEAVDLYYVQLEKRLELNKAKRRLAKSLGQNQKRLEKKISLEENDLARCEAADKYKEFADILAANMYYLQNGQDEVTLPSFENPDRPIKIELDPAMTPQENIQRYYKKYSKAKNSRRIIEEKLNGNREELAYLLTISQSLDDCDDIDELAIIEREATAAGFSKPHLPQEKARRKPAAPLPPRRCVSADGFVILIGRNNRQNDKLSLKMASADDIWLHTQKIPGSHTVIVTEGKNVPESTLLEAAAYAAWFSKARESGKTAVDYTLIANLKKPNGAVPGYVTYTGQTTLYVVPKEPLEDIAKEEDAKDER